LRTRKKKLKAIARRNNDNAISKREGVMGNTESKKRISTPYR